jgi:hypothetical protein
MEIDNASMWSHCSQMDWWYKQRSLKVQCGNADWYFWTFDSYCYWDLGIYYKTYCVKMDAANTAVSKISAKQSYGYSLSLQLYNKTMSMAANLTDQNPTSALICGNGAACGNASISGVSGLGQQPYDNYVVLNKSGALRAANVSYYSTYAQYLSSFNSFMDYHNGTDTDPAIAAMEISYFNSKSKELIAAPQAYNDQCSIATRGNKSYYSCKPASGLYYAINASISGVVHVASQSIAVEGSTIKIS